MPGEIIDWCFSCTILRSCITDSPEPGEATIIDLFVWGCTVLGRNTRQGNTTMISQCLAYALSRTLFKKSDKTLGTNVSIDAGWECIGVYWYHQLFLREDSTDTLVSK